MLITAGSAAGSLKIYMSQYISYWFKFQKEREHKLHTFPIFISTIRYLPLSESYLPLSESRVVVVASSVVGTIYWEGQIGSGFSEKYSSQS